MNELTIFENPNFGEVRTIDINDKPYFVAVDVARALGYSNPHDAIARHCKGVVKHEGVSININQYGTKTSQRAMMSFIPEGDIYRLITRSQLPEAEKFEAWVFDEVIPSIRKHGLYAMDELINNPDLAIKALTALKEEREKNAKLAAVNEELKPKAEIADAITESKDSISVGDMAKLLKQNGVEIGQNRFFDWLRANGYLMAGNKPTQKAMELKVFEIKERNITLPSGTDKIVMTPKVTAKGQEYFLKKLAMAAV